MPKRTKKQSNNISVEKVVSDFKSSWEYTQGSWHERWKDNIFLYNNQRVNRGYEGITDTFIPMAFSTVETLTAGVFGSKPKFSYLPPAEKQNQKTDILNSLLDFYWDKDQWSLKIINTGRNMFKLGTAVDYFFWNVDHPVLINVPIRDFFISPTSTVLSEGETPYCGRRYLTTIEELESFEVIDLEGEPDEDGNYPLKKKYTNLDKIKPASGSKGDNTDKQEKDMWYGSTITNPEMNQIEVIEYWTCDRVVSVANRSVIIEDSENYYKAKDRANGAEYPKGLLPFADARDYVDESLFYAKGEIDVIAEQQELLNDISNQNIDSITYILNQMYTLDPKYANLIGEIENLPGAVYPVEANALQPIPQRPIPPDAFLERNNIKNEIRETTASSEVVKGVGTQQGRATATEINAQIAGAGQRYQLKITQVENGYFYRVAKIILRMIQLYVTEPMMIRIIGRDGARWEEFDPSEFQGDYEPRVQLDVTLENQRQNEANEAKELLGAFMGDPDINQVELKRLVLSRSFNLDPDEVDTLMNNPQLPIESSGGVGPLPAMGELPIAEQPQMLPDIPPELLEMAL